MDAYFDFLDQDIQTLADATRSEINFSFREQYFQIEAESNTELEFVLYSLNKMLGRFMPKLNNEELTETSLLTVTEAGPQVVPSQSSTVQGSVVPESEPEWDVPQHTATFTFARTVAEPEAALVGPLEGGFRPTSYLDLVAGATETDCVHRDREITVAGETLDNVLDAVERFNTVQTLHELARKPTNVVVHMHYPGTRPYDGICFCDMEKYAHKTYIDLFDDLPSPLYVLLPVFKDPTSGEYEKPRDFIEMPPSPLLMRHESRFEDMAKESNLDDIQIALVEGLTDIRGYRGEIIQSAKLGKVLWNNLGPEDENEMAVYQTIEQVVMIEHEIAPVFNKVTTASEDIITRMTGTLPNPQSETAYFEVHAHARNLPGLPYKPVIMHLNQDGMGVQKVTSETKEITEINWISLDRKYDFQISLTAHELHSSDMRPYSTFAKKISICPNTAEVTFENVPDLLQVRHVFYKQKFRYLIVFPFVIEVTRVECVPLQPRGDRPKAFGLRTSSSNPSWYDIQVHCEDHQKHFEGNLHLGPGQLAPWTIEDILGPEDDPEKLIRDIKFMLDTIEELERLLA